MKKGVSKVLFLIIITLLLTLLASTSAAAEEPVQGPIATVTVKTDLVFWRPQIDSAGFVLTISGPEGFYLQREYQPDDRPIFRSIDGAGNPLLDGVYTYELRSMSLEAPTRYEEEQRGLDSQVEALVQSGSFSILNGEFVLQEVEESAATEVVTEIRAPNDHVILDDLIVDGSACIGFDCVNGESFGFDTVRLKENNLRIHFQDTSSSASFPTNDWTLIANDSTNGGANYFAIQDRDTSRNVFVVEAGAPASALYVEDYGRVGFGTSTPVVEAHIKDSDTPTVRLEQDGSGGWTPQTWDLAGNEANFFIRDVTNGSQLPFRIQPGADSNALTIKSDGNIGIGTWSPGGAVHIVRTGSNPKFVLERTDDHSDKWVFNAAAGGLRFAANDPAIAQMLIDTSGNLTIQGSLTQNSDVNAKENFAMVNSREILATVAELPISSWNFKFDDSSLRHLGPMAQDFYQAFGLGADEEHIAPLDTSGVALAAIQGLNEIVQEKDAQIMALEARLVALEQAVNARPAAQPSFLTVFPWLLCGALLLLAGVMGKRLYSAAKSGQG